jgi:hypothetical protein
MPGADAVLPQVEAEVADRLADLPSVLKQAVSAFEAATSAFPAPVTSGLLRLPILGEYARMIESLTAVSYFDVLTAQSAIPAQRSPAQSVALEPMA